MEPQLLDEVSGKEIEEEEGMNAKGEVENGKEKEEEREEEEEEIAFDDAFDSFDLFDDEKDDDEESHENPQNAPSITVRDVIDHLRPFFCDIVAEFADVETFLISMDSLLIELASHDYVDWSLGGATLPIVAMFESFLRSFIMKGGTFELLWFSDFGRIFESLPSLHLIRNTLKKHIEDNLSGEISVVTLKNPFQSDYGDYLKRLNPSFILMSVSSPEEKIEKFAGARTLENCLGTWYLKTLLVDKLPIVQLKFMDIRISSIHAFRQSSEGALKQISQAFEPPIIKALWKEAHRALKPHLSSANHYSTDQKPNALDDEKQLHFASQVLRRLSTAGIGISNEFRQGFILYCYLAENTTNLSLTYHAQKRENISVDHQTELEKLLGSLQFAMSLELDRYEGKVSNVFNGRLLSSTIEFVTEAIKLSKNIVPSLLKPLYTSYRKTCLEAGIPDIDVWELEAPKDTSLNEDPVRTSFPATDIEHPLIQRYAPEICDKVSELRKAHGVTFSNYCVFDPPLEEDAYHNTEEILFEQLEEEDELRGLTGWQRQRVLKNKQFYARWVQFYAQTLGCKNLAVTFSTSAQKPEKKSKVDKKSYSQKSSKPKPKTKAELIQEEKSRQDKKKALEDMVSKLAKCKRAEDFEIVSKHASAKKFPGVKARILFEWAMSLAETFNRTMQNASISLTDRRSQSLELMRILKRLLVDETKESDRTKGKETLSDLLSDEQRAQLKIVWKKLGLHPGSSSGLAMDLPSYLLAHGGELIDIQLNPVKDNRVTGFKPDEWQRRLLDAIDESKSALIVAPTSSGKTFISYYCMEKILRSDEDGVLIYVSPTKALVNQVAAEVSARFHNKTYKKNGRTLFGVLTRDYHHDVLNSQILITVPQCLENLLLMNHSNNWDKRIKYAVFDEVHCIGGGVGDIMGSEVWEHIILMLPSPFLALSATIGNPEGLIEWLRKLQAYKAENNVGRVAKDVVLIEHKERFSELELSLCPLAPKLNGEPQRGLISFHPLCSYSLKSLAKTGVSKGLVLTSQQIYNAYNALSGGVETEPDMMMPKNLIPNQEKVERLRDEWLSRRSLRDYEGYLMNILADSTTNQHKVLQEICSPIDEELTFRKRPLIFENIARQRVTQLVSYLHEAKQLPALCFSDNRKLCEGFAELVYDSLVEAYTNKIKLFERETKASQRKREQIQKIVKEAEKRAMKLKSKSKSGQNEDESSEIISIDMEDDGIPKLKDFALGKKDSDRKQFDEITDRIKRKDRETDSDFVRMLSLGIGVHHSGMSTSKRQAVEILFRSGHLGVVFCTSTLALGINMPCKTVVLCVDSQFLTPLQFRQMSGRAGRRGFDNKGNVVFMGIPEKKITRLLTASLSKLRGNTPCTANLVLRILCLLRNERSVEPEKSQLYKRIETMLHNPFLAHTLKEVDQAGSEIFEEQLKLNFVFHNHFLRMLGMVNERGTPVGLTGIFYRIYYHEPGNFILSRLFYSGIIRRICTQKTGNERDEALLILLSNIFTNRPLTIPPKFIQEASNSKVVLDEVDDEIIAIIQEYNDKVQELFRFFLQLFVELKQQPVFRLPISKLEFNAELRPKPTSSLEEFLEKRQPCRNTVQGPVFGLFGNEDSEIDLLKHYLVYPLSPCVLFDPAFLPAQNFPPRDHRGKVILRNGYAVDFWRHGIFKAIARDNCMMEGDVYSELNDFRRILKTISHSLDSLASDEDDEKLPLHEPVLQVFRDLASDYDNKFLNR